MWKRISFGVARLLTSLNHGHTNNRVGRLPDVERVGYPKGYLLDVGNVCNLRCPFCQTGKNDSTIERGLLKREDFDVILRKIAPHARFVSLINWGEAFLNKDILYFFSRCDVHGIKTHVDSNLNTKLWSGEEAEAIVKSGIGAILGSIDGTTQEAYSKYRVKGSLDMALQNLAALRAARDRLGRSRPFLGWSFYICKFNEHQVDEARRMASELGVGIWFKLLSCEDPTWRSIYHDRPDDAVLATPGWVGDIYPDSRPRSIIDMPLHERLPHVCTMPFSTMVINWNGDVYPCDVVYGDDFKLGNLVTQELSDVWFGDNYAKCRDFLRHYGPQQQSGAACQNNPCPVPNKWLDN